MVRILATLLALAVAPAAAQSCTEIKFPRGSFGTTISGIAPPDGLVCFSMATGNGQTARIDVVSGRNIFFSVRDVIDVQDSVAFRTRARTYYIEVGQLMRSVTNEAFSIAIDIR